MSAANGTRPLSVAIVGAGFSGIGTGIRLRREGIDDFTIYERGDSVGGVWRANTYPGAACDVPSHIYSFSFAPGHRWTRRFAPQPEILDYLNEVTDRFGIRPHLRLNTEVAEARFDPDAGKWTVTTEAGDSREYDVLVTACGQLTRPRVPAIAGLKSFKGTVFHSAEWDHEHDLAGKNVAVIGTGASAIQFVPEIAAETATTTIYQRSAPWVLPKADRAYPEWERRFFKAFPPRVALSRLGLFWLLEAGTYGFTGQDWVLKPAARLADSYRERSLPDPELRSKCTPDYKIGCKRILITSKWYETLNRDNVELLTDGIEKITPKGIVAGDGKRRPVDTIIWGTGFDAAKFTAPMRIYGSSGEELHDFWGETPSAVGGMVVPGYPNMFILYGPNTNHGSGSAPSALEFAFNYIVDGLRRMRDQNLKWIDVKPERLEEWRREIDERSADSVWVNGGCSSWYINPEGANTNNWPGAWVEMWRRSYRLNPGDYRAAVAEA
jgi:cation diffusion facilitator CzcD-associated flavoprotein CzcO